MRKSLFFKFRFRLQTLFVVGALPMGGYKFALILGPLNMEIGLDY
jgi:hypothetical protein